MVDRNKESQPLSQEDIRLQIVGHSVLLAESAMYRGYGGVPLEAPARGYDDSSSVEVLPRSSMEAFDGLIQSMMGDADVEV